LTLVAISGLIAVLDRRMIRRDVSSAVDVSFTSRGATSVMRGESGTMTIRMENQRL
jgi:hypothetical protein